MKEKSRKLTKNKKNVGQGFSLASKKRNKKYHQEYQIIITEDGNVVFADMPYDFLEIKKSLQRFS